MMGEVYNYGISGGREYDFGDKKVDYYAHGFHSLINFELKYDAEMSYPEIFKKYDSLLHGPLKGKSVLNYLTSHDDGQPYDKFREKSRRAANLLFLTPGGTQLYYGDETNRDIDIPGAEGDATLRSFMNWNEIEDPKIQKVLQHYQKLGQFKGKHPAIGAGKHQDLSQNPYTFSRIYNNKNYQDKVVVALDAASGVKNISVGGVFKEGTLLTDAYSGSSTVVTSGVATVDSPYEVVLLSKK
jgi:alpha-amylase